jgi:glycosyltransferase involved in cell wall biosynthesis
VKLVYLAPSDIQVARVDRQCIVSFCSALRRRGVDVELAAIGIRVLPGELAGPDVLSPYRIRDRFPTRVVRVPVSQESPDPWIALNRLLVHAACAVRALTSTPRSERLVFYTKTYSTGAVLLALRRLVPRAVQVVFEAHVLPRNDLQRLVVRRADRVVANTHALLTDLVEHGLVDRRRAIGTHQGVDVDLMDSVRVSKEAARARLGLPQDGKLAVYTGKIHEGYGEVEYLLEAARELERRSDIHFVLVGGRYDHVARFRRRAVAEERRNVTFAGFVAPNEVQDYQFAADALLLYYPADVHLNRYRSPGKLFEYMAAERAIVAVDLPVLREVVGDDAAVLVPPDSPSALASAVAGVLDDEERAAALAQAARRRVAEFSWDERARTIVEFVASDPAAAPEAGAVAAPDRVAPGKAGR